jgi:hypothetical protein
MATREKVKEWLHDREVEHVKRTVDILMELDHVVQAIHYFVDCDNTAITWYDLEVRPDGIAILGHINRDTIYEDMLLKKLGTHSVMVEVPDLYLEDDKYEAFIDYLLTKSEQYAEQLKQLVQMSKLTTKPTVH